MLNDFETDLFDSEEVDVWLIEDDEEDDEDEFDEGDEVAPVDISFLAFVKENPTYLNSLNNHIKELFNSYKWLSSGRYLKIAKTPAVNALVRRIGFGMLMRHALEVVSIDLCFSNGIEIGGKSVYYRLEKLGEQVVMGMDGATKKILNTALDYTNGTAHPHVIGRAPLDFDALVDFYTTSYRSVIENQMNTTDNNQVKGYLRRLLREMDNFSIKHPITRMLAKGCLARLLNECTVNRWCYNCNIAPTDISTAENPRSVSSLLKELSSWVNKNTKNAFGISALDQKVINNLYQIKSASNDFMHISPDKISILNVYKCHKILQLVRYIIFSECSPDAVEMKFNPKRSRSTVIATTLLCGFGGILGAHHFFAGNISCGISRILYLALYVWLRCIKFSVLFWAPFFSFVLKLILFALPFIDMMYISDGEFETAKWGMLTSTSKGTRALASALNIMLIIVFVTV